MRYVLYACGSLDKPLEPGTFIGRGQNDGSTAYVLGAAWRRLSICRSTQGCAPASEGNSGGDTGVPAAGGSSEIVALAEEQTLCVEPTGRYEYLPVLWQLEGSDTILRCNHVCVT